MPALCNATTQALFSARGRGLPSRGRQPVAGQDIECRVPGGCESLQSRHRAQGRRPPGESEVQAES